MIAHLLRPLIFFRSILFFCIIFCFNISLFAQDETDSCTVENKKAVKLVKQGISEMKAKKYTDALKTFREAIDMEPDYAAPYYYMGKIYFKKYQNPANVKENMLASVKRYYRKTVELCPTFDISCYYVLGDIFQGEENYDSAYYYMNEYMKYPDKIKNDSLYDYAESVVSYTKSLKTLKSSTVPFNPIYVTNISTPLDEYLPLISPDNELAFFTRKTKLPKSKNVITSDAQDTYKEKFMYSERGSNGEFDAGTEMPLPFNTTENQGAATVTIDNKTLYFVYCAYAKKSTYYNCDICKSEKQSDGKWSAIKNLGKKVNGDSTWESQPSISSDGKTLYFISDRPGGYGGYDIYKTTQDSSGNWTLAQNLGANINSKGNEKTPYIHSDNLTLYFSSLGWPGLGGYDIYYSRKGLDSKFRKPKNIGYPINTEYDDVGFTVSTDGHYGYFASNKYKGPGGWDIYYFDLYPGARPDTVILVKGNVNDVIKNEPTSARVELKNVKTKQITQIPVDSASGKYVFTTLFKNDYTLTVKKDDYAYTSKYLSTKDTAIINKPTEVKVDFDVKPIMVGEAYRLNDIYFAYGSYELTEDSKIIMDGFLDFLNDHPTMKISINGHTDNVSSAEFNQTLSENRAKAVYDYLVDKGISVTRLTYKGYGLKQPIATNDTEAGRAKNRRTEFVIVEK
jgi:outer membrane protein OmpA-like peptidoglycan-associated protein/tetratricopeptide (TPR) repeat protein